MGPKYYQGRVAARVGTPREDWGSLRVPGPPTLISRHLFSDQSSKPMDKNRIPGIQSRHDVSTLTSVVRCRGATQRIGTFTLCELILSSPGRYIIHGPPQIYRPRSRFGRRTRYPEEITCSVRSGSRPHGTFPNQKVNGPPRGVYLDCRRVLSFHIQD